MDPSGPPFHHFAHAHAGTSGWIILTAVSTTVLAVAAVIALLQIWEVRRSRHAQTAADFSRRWDEKDLIDTRQLTRQYVTAAALKDAYFRFVADRTTDTVYKLLREPDYFEDLAILQVLKAMDYEFIRRSLGDIIVRRWQEWEPTIDEMQRRNEGRDNYPHFRALAARLRQDPERS